MPAPLLGLVLAGGESRRMGVDKGTLLYHGIPQRAHAAGLLAPLVESVFVSVRPDQAAGLEPGLTPILDPSPGLGPIAGLLGAIGHRPDAAWLVVACDLPHLAPATLEALVDARADGLDAVAYRGTDDRPDPMVMIWEPSTHAAIRHAVANGRLSMRDVLTTLRVRLLPRPTDDTLDDIDSPPPADARRC